MIPFLLMSWVYLGFALFFAFAREPGDFARRMIYGRGGHTATSRRILAAIVAVAVVGFTVYSARFLG